MRTPPFLMGILSQTLVKKAVVWSQHLLSLGSFSSAALVFLHIWKWPGSEDKKASIQLAQSCEEPKVPCGRAVLLTWMFHGRNLNPTYESLLSHWLSNFSAEKKCWSDNTILQAPT